MIELDGQLNGLAWMSGSPELKLRMTCDPDLDGLRRIEICLLRKYKLWSSDDQILART